MTKGKASITKATVINALATLSPRTSTSDLSGIERLGTDFFIASRCFEYSSRSSAVSVPSLAWVRSNATSSGVKMSASLSFLGVLLIPKPFIPLPSFNQPLPRSSMVCLPPLTMSSMVGLTPPFQ